MTPPRVKIPGLELMEGRRSLTFYALKISQPIGDFYSAVIPADRLAEICYFDIRGLTQRDDFAEFMGIQRELDAKRVADIKRYVRTLDPSFPTAIVLAVDEHCATFEQVEISPGAAGERSRVVRMTLKNYPDRSEGLDPVLYRDIARIIDGQHRIAGLLGYSGPAFDLNVSIFVGADIATQASIFSTVNLAQTKVNKSLVYDLFSYAETPSPEKTCHEVAMVLDSEPKSPFYKRIKRLGVATEGRFTETLSQAAFVKGLIPYVSKDVLADRDAAKRGKPYPHASHPDLILRPYFVEGKDEIIVDLLWDYFDAVKHRWPTAWDKTGRGWVLNKTAGYAGLMRLLKPCLAALSKKNSLPSRQDFDRLFAVSKLGDDAFESSNIRPGTSGEKYVFDLLARETQLTDHI